MSSEKVAQSAIRGFLEMTGVVVVGLGLWSLGLPDLAAGLLTAVGTAIAIGRYYRRLEG